VASEDELATDAAELLHVHYLALGKVRNGQDHDVAGSFPGMQHEEQALAPMVVVSDDVGQRLGNLVEEELVGGGQLGQFVSSRGLGWPLSETS
jgi:hypothetical protein